MEILKCDTAMLSNFSLFIKREKQKYPENVLFFLLHISCNFIVYSKIENEVGVGGINQ